MKAELAHIIANLRTLQDEIKNILLFWYKMIVNWPR